MKTMNHMYIFERIKYLKILIENYNYETMIYIIIFRMIKYLKLYIKKNFNYAYFISDYFKKIISRNILQFIFNFIITYELYLRSFNLIFSLL